MAGGDGRWPSSDEVISALHSSGHLLEQEVATSLERLGFNVVTNRGFLDEDEGKSREIDVWAHHSSLYDEDAKVSVRTVMLVECKATAAPFAFLTRPVGGFEQRPPEEILFPVPAYKRNVRDLGGGRNTYTNDPAFSALDLANHYWPFTDGRRGVAIVRLHRQKGEWQADNASVFDSLVYPLAKAVRAFRKDFDRNGGRRAAPRPEEWASFVVFVPTVVVASRLFEVDGTASDPTAAATGHVRLQRELRSTNLNGLFGIDFVHNEHLASWVQGTVLPFAEKLVEIVQQYPEIARTNEPTRKPWQDA